MRWVLITSALVDDEIAEDSSLVIDTPKGPVVITGRGHAGTVNIVTFSEKHFGGKPI